jgi:hypothetical protein
MIQVGSGLSARELMPSAVIVSVTSGESRVNIMTPLLVAMLSLKHFVPEYLRRN